jgi:hypothetical protein
VRRARGAAELRRGAVKRAIHAQHCLSGCLGPAQCANAEAAARDGDGAAWRAQRRHAPRTAERVSARSTAPPKAAARLAASGREAPAERRTGARSAGSATADMVAVKAAIASELVQKKTG